MGFFTGKKNNQNVLTLIEQQAEILKETSEHMRYYTTHEELRQGDYEQIKEYERKADEIAKKVLSELDRMVMTPIEAPECLRLVRKIDGVIDALDTTAHLMSMYKVDATNHYIGRFANIAIAMAVEIFCGIQAIQKNDIAKMRQCYDELGGLEKDADNVYEEARVKLLMVQKEGKIVDALEVLRYKDVYAAWESAIDAAEEIADVLATIIARNTVKEP